MNRHILVVFLCVVMLLACKKEQLEQPELAEFNRNCSCAKEVSADFTMEEQTTSNPNFVKYTNTDTIFKNKNVRFTALENSADYTWYIGTEIISNKTVSRYFSDAWVGENIPVTLVVKKKPNLICLPNDDGYDSITKILHVSEFPFIVGSEVYLGSIEGVYRVKSAHLPDSFDIEFYVDIASPGFQYFNVINYDGVGSDCIHQARAGGGNYRQVWSTGGTSVTQCDYLRGSVHNRIDGITEIKFTFGAGSPTNANYYERTYLGRKL